MIHLNETHDPQLTSWVESANITGDFPLQNLPFAIFRRAGSSENFRGGVAIGDQVLDMAAVLKTQLLSGEAANAAAETTLNRLMSLGAEKNAELRLSLSRALRSDADKKIQQVLRQCLIPQSAVEFNLPCRIGDYTDFYSSINHATAVGRLFRPDQPLLPNYKWVPIGYHGRSSSIGVSGQQFHRPIAQRKGESIPEFGPTERLDYELELGIFLGASTKLGDQITIEQAEQHIFGFCVFNDWSARDIQAWEYQPLGPFLGKNFASTISPWVVTLEALAPYRTGFSHPEQDPQPLPYLSSKKNTQHGGLDIQMQALIETEKMRAENENPVHIAGSSFKHSYWTAAQMVTHHSVNGCNMNAGDLLGSGTQSGEAPDEAGSLLELSEGGKKAFNLPNGEQRTFLEDGDKIIMRAFCNANSATKISIGFGEATGLVLPAKYK
jgi:fumarylacetoacetase